MSGESTSPAPLLAESIATLSLVMQNASDDLLARDRAALWHPYTQHRTELAPLPVVGARGSVLELADGREVIDAVSSWWANTLGHGREELAEAAAAQWRRLDHVLFAGATHVPAVELAEALLAQAPAGLTRVFYSDDGSTAVEVALKIVLQGWRQRGEPRRDVLVALEGGYHGDTFGAMAVGDPDPFFLPFRAQLFEARRTAPDINALEAALDGLGERAAGVILEPLVQGAGGMRMQEPAFLRAVRSACDARGLPLIADEVMTGFGRTGALFACRKAGVSPDLLCLAKGLSGGTFPIAATLVSEAWFEPFLSEERARALFHGHTFTASPIGCAVALRALELTLAEDVPARLDVLGRRIEAQLGALLVGDERARDLRRCGGIVAFDLTPRPGDPPGYLATRAPRLRERALTRGVLLRPLGNVIYAMPPASTTEAQADDIAHAMADLVEVA